MQERTCIADRCERTPVCKGCCDRHYRRLKKYGDVNTVMPPKVNTSWSGNRRSFPTPIRNRIMVRDKWLCQIRGLNCLGIATEADHRTPHAEGGTDDVSNGQAACTPCHKAKTQEERMRGRKRHSRYREPTQHPGLN